MKFNEAIGVKEARTENGMKALSGSGNKVVDLFYNIGASRGKDIVPQFVSALTDNTDWALRVALWARDVRGGAGERKIFRDILTYLVKNDKLKANAMLDKIGTLGRWDDLWSVFGLDEKIDNKILDVIITELEKGNGLMAKWLPRQKEVINGKDLVKALRERMHLSPSAYRKLVVTNTNVVEQYMCQKNWNEINFSHVPSLAHSRYKKAFYKNAESYKAYVEALVKGDNPEVKINAGAVYPYDVIKGFFYKVYKGWGETTREGFSQTEIDVINAQWKALPNYMGDDSVLALVDVSGSMEASVGGGSSVTAMDVAVSLGLYVSDKLKGDFKDCMLTFNTQPELLKLSGTVVDKLGQMANSAWGGSTDLHKALDLILKTATNCNLAPEDMPKTLVILSDMQFNSCIRFDDSAIQMIRRKYTNAGYEVPNIVFWNLRATGNTPVTMDTRGVALVSGFSPSILPSILGGKDFSPRGIMLETILKDRYDY